MACSRLFAGRTIIVFVAILVSIILKLNAISSDPTPVDHTARAAANYVLSPGPLLGRHGELLQAGWATSLVKQYDRDNISAAGFRIKEWDYYYIGNSDVGFAFTIADNSYVGMISVSLLNFTSRTYITKSKILPVTFGSLNLPSTSKTGDIEYRDEEGYMLRIAHLHNGDENVEKKLQIEANWPEFFDGATSLESFSATFTLSNTTHDSMVIVSPFDAAPSRTFYYNQKINNMPATGQVVMRGGQETIQFKSDAKLLSVFDWGRGVWTYDNTWYWSSLSTYLPATGDTLGFNLGYGFSIRNGFSENMIIFNGKAHKLGNVHFYIPVNDAGQEDFMAKWKISDDEGRLALIFVPVLDRFDDVNLFVIRSWQHQVFGKFYGKVVLDDDRIVELNGESVGFAEKVANRW